MSGVCQKASVRKPGAWASLRPTLHVPMQARVHLVAGVAAQYRDLGARRFFRIAGTSLVRTATGSTSNLIGGATVAALTLTGALMIFTLRNRPAAKALLLGGTLLPSGCRVDFAGRAQCQPVPVFPWHAGRRLRIRRRIPGGGAQSGAAGACPMNGPG